MTGLLLFPVAGPVWAVRVLAEQVRNDAESMLYDEAHAFSEIIDLSMRHAAGELSDSEFNDLQAELLERLSSMRDHRNELLNEEMDGDDDEWLEVEIDGDDVELIDEGAETDDDLLLDGDANAAEEYS